MPSSRYSHYAVYTAVRGIVITTPWLFYLLFTDILLSLLFPFSFLYPDHVYNLSSKLAAGVWRSIQLIFTRLNGAKITCSGAALPQDESAIVVSNHVSWTDFYMIQALAIKARMLGRCRYFAKQQL